MKRVPVILFGAGGVGRALLQQILDGREAAARRNGCHFDVVAVCDSRSWLWQPEGLSETSLEQALAAKRSGRPLHDSQASRPSGVEIIERAVERGLQSVIVVDVTAEAGMEPVLDRALAAGFGLALANKKALAGPWATAQRYFNHPRIRHESTVGGGQPVIATLRYLLDVNDPIYEIEGQLSGTLGYICGCLDQGQSFSAAVQEARALGYTEPDPREDLGGLDVMRKVMILGRMAGWPLEASDIEVESLYPAEMAQLSVPDFLAQAAQLDEAFSRRVAAAAKAGNVLRYVASLGPRTGRVGLQAMPAGSALANLKYISFRTARYDDEPLLIGGKGAGVQMTAAGVMGDMIDLVREGGGG